MVLQQDGLYAHTICGWFVLPVWSYLTYMQSEMTCVVLIRLGNGMIEHLAEYLTMEASISKAENDVSSDGDNSGELARC